MKKYQAGLIVGFASFTIGALTGWLVRTKLLKKSIHVSGNLIITKKNNKAEDILITSKDSEMFEKLEDGGYAILQVKIKHKDEPKNQYDA